MAWAATRVSSIERSSHSDLTKRSTSRSAYWTISGAASMDSTRAATVSWMTDAGKSAVRALSVSRTKPNSPPPASHRPVRTAVPELDPNSRDRPATTANLAVSSSASSPATASRLAAM